MPYNTIILIITIRVFIMIYRLSCALLLTTSMVQNTFAVEGGIGRPITGMQVQPYNAILPAENGGVLTL